MQLHQYPRVRLTVGLSPTNQVLEIDDEELWVALYVKYRGLSGGVNVDQIVAEAQKKLRPPVQAPKEKDKALNAEIIEWIIAENIPGARETMHTYPGVTRHRAAALIQSARFRKKRKALSQEKKGGGDVPGVS